MESCEKMKARRIRRDGRKDGTILDLPISILVEEIFLRLPLKAIIRLRCVCKIFNKLLKDPCFLNAYRTKPSFGIILRYPPLTSLYDLFWLQFEDERDCSTPTVVRVNMPDDYGSPIPLISCNGLVAFKTGRSTPDDTMIFICNPVLGEFFSLPSFKRTGWSAYGLGFSPSNNQYKFLINQSSVSAIGNPRAAEVTSYAQIFTIGADVKWRSVEDPVCPYMLQGSGVAFDGAIYWKLNVFLYSKNGKYHDLLCAFDVVEEKYRYIDITPLDLKKRGSKWDLRVLENLLCIVDHSKSGELMNIWIMEESGKSWSRKYSISNNWMSTFSRTPYPVGIQGDGDQMIISVREALISYNLITKQRKKVEVKGVGEFEVQFGFAPSLISLKDVVRGGGEAARGQILHSITRMIPSCFESYSESFYFPWRLESYSESFYT